MNGASLGNGNANRTLAGPDAAALSVQRIEVTDGNVLQYTFAGLVPDSVYELYIHGVSNDAALPIRIRPNGDDSGLTSTWLSDVANDHDDNNIQIGFTSTDDNSFSVKCTFFNLATDQFFATATPTFHAKCYYRDGDGQHVFTGTGAWSNDSTPVTSLLIEFSGAITGGTFLVLKRIL